MTRSNALIVPSIPETKRIDIKEIKRLDKVFHILLKGVPDHRSPFLFLVIHISVEVPPNNAILAKLCVL